MCSTTQTTRWSRRKYHPSKQRKGFPPASLQHIKALYRVIHTHTEFELGEETRALRIQRLPWSWWQTCDYSGSVWNLLKVILGRTKELLRVLDFKFMSKIFTHTLWDSIRKYPHHQEVWCGDIFKLHVFVQQMLLSKASYRVIQIALGYNVQFVVLLNCTELNPKVFVLF